MWLINTQTRQLEEFQSEKAVEYAILSHTWGKDEVSLRDITSNADFKSKAGYQKIDNTCQQAIRDGLDYAWIDTCCIDKSSSAELSEAINSMWRWYEAAVVCYAHLEDVPAARRVARQIADRTWSTDEYSLEPASCEAAFRGARWFTRGWTLQELIAPLEVQFFSQDWAPIGSRITLRSLLNEITQIPIRLLHRSVPASYVNVLGEYSIAQKMSWAARRSTSRPEDLAYSLLGLFDLNMPLLYGEGRKAFYRLQTEIIKASTDHSIFAWGEGERSTVPEVSFLAYEPGCFSRSGNVLAKEPGRPMDSYDMTNRGLRICLPIVRLTKADADAVDSVYAAMRRGEWADDSLVAVEGSKHEIDSRIPFNQYRWAAALNCRQDGKHLWLLLKTRPGNWTDEVKGLDPEYQALRWVRIMSVPQNATSAKKQWITILRESPTYIH